MRNPSFHRLAILIATLALCACGPSSKELTGAKTAHYKGDKLVMFNAIKTTVAEKYHIEKSDETSLGMQPVGRWYTPEGLTAGERNDDLRDVPDKSLRIALVVTGRPGGGAGGGGGGPRRSRGRAGAPK